MKQKGKSRLMRAKISDLTSKRITRDTHIKSSGHGKFRSGGKEVSGCRDDRGLRSLQSRIVRPHTRNQRKDNIIGRKSRGEDGQPPCCRDARSIWNWVLRLSDLDQLCRPFISISRETKPIAGAMVGLSCFGHSCAGLACANDHQPPFRTPGQMSGDNAHRICDGNGLAEQVFIEDALAGSMFLARPRDSLAQGQNLSPLTSSAAPSRCADDVLKPKSYSRAPRCTTWSPPTPQ